MKALHPQIKPAGMVYQAALRAELTTRLGVVWGPVSEDGQAEILGVPEQLQTKWSSRRRDIEAVGRTLIAEQEAKLERRLTPGERVRPMVRRTMPWYDGWRPSRDEADAHAGWIGESWNRHGVHKWLAYDRDTGEVVGRGGLSRTPVDDDWGQL